MKNSNSELPNKLDRKTVERNRRIHMKNLCLKLSSLIPPHHFKHSKEILSQQDQLDHAARYIKELTERIEKLKMVKEEKMRSLGVGSSKMDVMIKNDLPVFELRELGSSIEVVLISVLKKNFMLYEVISILEQEGAEVVSASFSTVGDKIFHTIHAQVRISRVGVETTRVRKRLHELIC